MSNVIVIKNILRPQEREVACLPAGMTLRRWADGHYPNRVTRTYIDGVECDGCVLEDQIGAIVVYPADPVSAAIAWFSTIGFAQLAASVALNLVIGALFKPKKPSTFTAPEASKAYSISATQNAARLGAPIPVIYGEVLCVPDYAAQPVSEFVANEQYLYSLFCIGQGEYEVLDTLIGNTSTKNIDPKFVHVQVFPPAIHQKTFGNIQGAYGIPENTFTNQEVVDQELVAPTTTPVPSIYFWRHTGTISTLPPAGSVEVTAGGLPADTTAFAGALRHVRTLIGDNEFVDTYAYTLLAGNTPSGADVRVNDTISTVHGAYIGAFEMCLPGQVGTEAALDFVFPGGIYDSTGGGLGTHSVQLEIVFVPLSIDGIQNAQPIVHIETFTNSTNNPIRETKRYTLPSSRYACKARRITLAGAQGVVDRVNWVGLKFKLGHPAGTPVYGDVTLAGVAIRATEGVSSSSANQIKFRVRRKLKRLGTGAFGTTHNPADALVDIYTAAYGGKRSATAAELDIPQLELAHGAWSYHNGFNAVFDQNITVWEAMNLAVQTVAAVPLPVGQQISLAHDGVKANRVAMFTDGNIVADSLNIQYEFAKVGDPSAYRVEYRDHDTFQPSYVTAPESAEFSSDVQSITLFGCTDRNTAAEHARLQYNRLTTRRKSITFETEYEGLAVRHGDRIAVSHSLPEWGQNAFVVDFLPGGQVVLDKDLDWTSGAHALLMRDDYGVPVLVENVVQGSQPNIVVLPSGGTVPGGNNGEPTLVAFGSLTKYVTDWIVTSMEPTGDLVQIGAVAYMPEIYRDAMPHQSIGMDSDGSGGGDPERVRWIVAGDPIDLSLDVVSAGTPSSPSIDIITAGSPSRPGDAN